VNRLTDERVDEVLRKHSLQASTDVRLAADVVSVCQEVIDRRAEELYTASRHCAAMMALIRCAADECRCEERCEECAACVAKRAIADIQNHAKLGIVRKAPGTPGLGRVFWCPELSP
jgi:histone H3/H4